MSAPLPGQLELPLSPEPERLSGWEQTEREEGGPLPERALVPETGTPYQAHSTTSREAAEWQNRTGAAATLELYVLRLFMGASFYGMTDEELDERGEIEGLPFKRTLRPRRVALWHKGLIDAAPGGRTRRTSTGRQAVVWVITPKGEGCL